MYDSAPSYTLLDVKLAVFSNGPPIPLTKSVPVEPFGGEEDFDVNGRYLVYTTKDPSINEATHTRQNVSLEKSSVHFLFVQPLTPYFANAGLPYLTRRQLLA